MNISLPEALKAHVDEQVASGSYGTSSEYVRELIRKDRDVKKLRMLLLEGGASEPDSTSNDAFFAQLKAQIASGDV
ncbi:type II toxin-antitoxin system ParD family antitoxin [Pelagibacterium luteolum]|uniref:Antitoxin ParD1/3/4 n=1 Tax=Pelagibacterium luteolum TaxID=440168 RepID=A0A1G7VXP9_9HYPH|nr:antitoxin ParD1/3/4 [Pelagibacterium luteolum]